MGKPRRSISSNPVDEREQVVCRPLFGDLAVHYAVHVNRIPPDVSARRRNAEEVALCVAFLVEEGTFCVGEVLNVNAGAVI